MTKKKSQGLEQDPKPASKKPSIERQSVDVTITLESPDFFANLDTCTTSEYAATDSVIIAYSKEVDGEGGRHFYQLFEQNGKRIKGIWVPFSLTLRDVISGISSTYISGSKYSASAASGRVKISKIVERFPEYLHAEIISRFDKAFGNTSDTYATQFTDDQRKIFLANPRARLVRSIDGTSILAHYQDKLYEMKLYSSSGEMENKDKLDFIAKEISKGALKEKTDTHIPDTDLSIHSERGVIQIVHEHKDKIFHSDACADFAVDPLNGKRVYYAVPGTNELRVIDTSLITESLVPVTSIKLPIPGEIKEFNIDPNGNFFLVLMKQDDGTVLHILERDKLTTVKIVSDVKENIQLDSIGTVYFIDTNNRLRAAHTNFLSYEKGGLQKAYEDRRKKLLDLQAKIKKGILLPDVAASDHIDPAHAQEDSLVVKIASEIDALFDPLIAGAQTLADVDKQSDQVAALKVSDDYRAYPELFVTVELKIRERERDLKQESLQGAIAECKAQLAGVVSISDVVECERMMADIRKGRRDIVGMSATTKSELDGAIRELDEAIALRRNEYRDQCHDRIEALLGVIGGVIATASSKDDLNHIIATDDNVAEFEELLGYVDHAEGTRFRIRYRDLLIAQNTSIDRAVEEEIERENFRIARILEESEEILESISLTIDNICATVKSFDKWLLISNNPIVTRFRAKILSLPDDLRHEQESKLEELLKSKRRDLEHRQSLQITRDSEEVDFGSGTFPVFRASQVVWQPKVVPLSEGSDHGHLTFADNLGHVFRAPSGAVPLDVSDDLTRETIAAYKTDATKYFESLKRVVPGFNDTWVMSDYFKGYLSKMARLLRLQMEHGKGIMILEGEAGVGKNVLVDMFCHFTNRETHTFSCNFQTEKEDITYAFNYDKNRGTYTVDSQLIKMLQTPGAVIVLDEINTLPPGVSKMLNPLLDYRRSLYLPDGRVIKAHPSVLIVGTMNPQHYIGVKPLSQEVKSRARIVYMDYPPLMKGHDALHDEALVLSRFVPSLKDLNNAEFVVAWDYIVNHNAANGGDRLVTETRTDDCAKLYMIIKIAGLVREAYRAFRTGKSADPVEFVFSMRETVDIATELAHSADVKDAIRDVVLPKVSDELERKSIETIIANA